MSDLAAAIVCASLKRYARECILAARTVDGDQRHELLTEARAAIARAITLESQT
jgi:hypothetical protein